jgi:hypothetical protein
MNKSKIVTIVILAVVIFIAIFFWVAGGKKSVLKPALVQDTNNVSDSTSNNPSNLDSLNIPAGDIRILGNRADLIASSIWPNAEVGPGILSYRGSVKGGYFFEANLLINILDTNKKVLKSSNAVATSDWMTSLPVSFEGNIDFTGLPAGPAYFQIHNDNASGLPANDKSILIPIVIK